MVGMTSITVIFTLYIMAKKTVNLFHKDQLGYTFYSILYTCAYHHVLGFSALQDSMKDIDYLVLILANMVT